MTDDYEKTTRSHENAISPCALNFKFNRGFVSDGAKAVSSNRTQNSQGLSIFTAMIMGDVKAFPLTSSIDSILSARLGVMVK